MLLSLAEVDGEVLLQELGSRLEGLGDVLEIGDNGGPALLLQMLIVDEALADAGLVAGQDAALLGQLGPGHNGLVRGRHRDRRVHLALQIDICNIENIGDLV